jgi:hypothetical protein
MAGFKKDKAAGKKHFLRPAIDGKDMNFTYFPCSKSSLG